MREFYGLEGDEPQCGEYKGLCRQLSPIGRAPGLEYWYSRSAFHHLGDHLSAESEEWVRGVPLPVLGSAIVLEFSWGLLGGSVALQSLT